MSSLLVCSQPLTGNPEALVPLDVPALLRRLSAVPQLSRVSPASRLDVRPAPEVVPGGIAGIDALTGGLPRGCLTEIYGPPSSGCTSVLLAALAEATRRREACALVDVSNAFDPQSATRVDLQQLLWVRCSPPHKTSLSQKQSSPRTGIMAPEKNPEFKSDMARLTQALKATDLLLQSGGFGLVAIDLSGIPHAASRRIPLASWFRFRRAVENTPTVLLVLGQGSCAKTCASLVLRLQKSPGASTRLFAGERALGQVISVHNFPHKDKSNCPGSPTHARLLNGISVTVELQRSRLNRKPPQSDKTGFETRTAWSG